MVKIRKYYRFPRTYVAISGCNHFRKTGEYTFFHKFKMSCGFIATEVKRTVKKHTIRQGLNNYKIIIPL